MKSNVLIPRILILLLFSLCHCTEEKKDRKPNIVFIFADDMTYEAVGALGNTTVKTPHLDDLIKNGTTFTHAYNMGGWNGAICVASRAMLISGRSIWQAKSIDQKWRADDKEAIDQTWPRLMEKAGYDTYMTGKWHVQTKADEIFQTTQHIRPGMPKDLFPYDKMKEYVKYGGYDPATWADIMPAGYNRPLDSDDSSWSPIDSSFGGFWAGSEHWSEVVRHDALGFIENTKLSINPFFMYLAFNAPHDPRQAPKEYLDMYPIGDIPLPENWLSMYPYKDSIGCDPTLRDEALAPFPRTPLAIKTHLREYYAIITHLDDQIGMIIEGLKKSVQLDNTYIIFTADHGLSVGHHGLTGKQNMYEHSIRVPFVIVGPDIPKNKRVASNIYLQDAMATALELAEFPKPMHVDFQSVLSDIRSDVPKADRDMIYGAYMNYQRMIRKGGYKLIVYPKVPTMRLYDLKSDPLEMMDLSNEPEYQRMKDSLYEALINEQQRLGDKLELGGVF